ncbi:ribosome-assembly protein 3-domain-containing protein [Scheffersomyces amazonensis]|uniref:ribosome-assembly protein 3-domain-containing protein n=1 Tax=Scheffersomyces amazonensis TaxID=1078765 RepID=UPI00315CD197
MAPPAAHKKANRRRKKRRTEDFSSDSDSDSDRDSTSITNDNNQDHDSITIENNNNNNNINDNNDIDIDIDIDIDSDSETKTGNVPDPLTPHIHKQLNAIKLTTNQLSTSNSATTSIPKGTNISSIKQQIDEDKAQLNTQYLRLMTQEFSQDLDELRKKPDFSDKSLVILAKTLQQGGNLFDKSVIDELLSK